MCEWGVGRRRANAERQLVLEAGEFDRRRQNAGKTAGFDREKAPIPFRASRIAHP